MANYNKLLLKPGKEVSIKRFHPWIFSGAIHKTIGSPNEGDVVDLFSNDGQFLARGHYQPDSITVRILTFEEELIDSVFWKKTFEQCHRTS